MMTRLAGLDVRVVSEVGGPPTAAVVLCHGFGAPGDDLVGLAQELASSAPALKRVRFYFPEAPLSLGNMGYGDSRAWWLIDLQAINRLQQGDEAAFREFRQEEPKGMAAARATMLKLVAEVAQTTGLPLGRIVLGGFSQGAMIATDITLRLEEPPLGLAILSGTLLIESVWAAKAKARAGLPVFQSHGRQDPILAYKTGVWLNELLTNAGLKVDFVPFDGGHGIAPEVLEGLAWWLAARVA